MDIDIDNNFVDSVGDKEGEANRVALKHALPCVRSKECAVSHLKY